MLDGQQDDIQDDSATTESADEGAVEAGAEAGEHEEPKESRRQRAAREARESRERIAAFEAQTRQLSEQLSQLSERDRARDRELAEIRARDQARAEQEQERQRRERDAAEDPGKLRREAADHLAQGRMDEYHDLISRAIRSEMRRELEPMIRPSQQGQQSGPPPADPYMQMQIQHLMSKYEHVRAAGPVGFNVAVAEDQKLQFLGVPGGVERWERAFQAANAALQQSRGAQTRQPGPAFGRGAAGAVGQRGGHASAGAGDGDGGGSDLSPAERDMARRFKMSEAEFKKFKRPGSEIS